MLESIIKIGKKQYPQTLLEECKYEIKKKIESYSNDGFDSSSSDESDNEESNESDSEESNRFDDDLFVNDKSNDKSES